MRRSIVSAAAALAAVVGAAEQARAQNPFTWENATELSYVSTGGNASSNTLGLKASLTGTGGPNQFKLEVGGIRSETNVTTRRATGTATQFTITKTVTQQLTAENYFARSRYDRAFSQAFLFAGAGWERNTFAGIRNRYSVVTGVGRTFVDGDTGHFKADLGATFTIQRDVDPEPDIDEEFLGVRVSLDATRQLSEAADYASALVVDQNAEQSSDLRADWINSITFSLTQSLAFKTSVQILFDNKPAQISVPLFDSGSVQTGTVRTAGEKVDNILTLTLVIRL